MASRHPRRDTPSVYRRDCPLLRGEGSSSGAASVGGDERTTRGSSHRRQRSPPSPYDEVLEEEHVVATATSSSEDKRGQQMGEGGEALEGEGGEELEGDRGGTATRTPYELGPTSLPPVPLPHNRPVIRPMAKRAWLVLLGTPARTPASILSVLCRKWYPGIVQLSEEPVVREPASNWDRYALVTNDTYRNKQERVLAEFWKFFKAKEGLEA
ncbi:uncharacterized protein [Miscanthus floridulus]|uniref:uncharacterized protein n=1 Tax=Miscanthus floridulus TaxID=154761 RepID=UPI0034591E26